MVRALTVDQGGLPGLSGWEPPARWMGASPNVHSKDSNCWLLVHENNLLGVISEAFHFDATVDARMKQVSID